VQDLKSKLEMGIEPNPNQTNGTAMLILKKLKLNYRLDAEK